MSTPRQLRKSEVGYFNGESCSITGTLLRLANAISREVFRKTTRCLIQSH